VPGPLARARSVGPGQFDSKERQAIDAVEKNSAPTAHSSQFPYRPCYDRNRQTQTERSKELIMNGNVAGSSRDELPPSAAKLFRVLR
jgi:hypothetical protein